MDLFFVFISEQWILIGSLLALIFMLAFYESRKGGAVIDPQKLVNLMNHQSGVVVDLRATDDFQAGHIAGALNIPAHTLQNSLAQLQSSAEKPLILVCKMGQHSGPAASQLKKAGFESLYRLRGGIAEWRRDQLPLVSSAGEKKRDQKSRQAATKVKPPKGKGKGKKQQAKQ